MLEEGIGIMENDCFNSNRSCDFISLTKRGI